MSRFNVMQHEMKRQELLVKETHECLNAARKKKHVHIVVKTFNKVKHTFDYEAPEGKCVILHFIIKNYDSN